MRALAFVAFLILLGTSLASCGHKGPLQLPEPEEALSDSFIESTEPEA